MDSKMLGKDVYPGAKDSNNPPTLTRSAPQGREGQGAVEAPATFPDWVLKLMHGLPPAPPEWALRMQAEARVEAAARESVEQFRAALRLLEWLTRQGEDRFHFATVYQCGPARLRRLDRAREALLLLTEAGYLERLPPGTMVGEIPRRDAWRLTGKVWTLCSP